MRNSAFDADAGGATGAAGAVMACEKLTRVRDSLGRTPF
jgi:hypothetical protein